MITEGRNSVGDGDVVGFWPSVNCEGTDEDRSGSGEVTVVCAGK